MAGSLGQGTCHQQTSARAVREERVVVAETAVQHPGAPFVDLESCLAEIVHETIENNADQRPADVVTLTGRHHY